MTRTLAAYFDAAWRGAIRRGMRELRTRRVAHTENIAGLFFLVFHNSSL
jgi:hypothetical protein